jgi:hypothetical protein
MWKAGTHFHLRSSVKYDFHCADFHETRNHSNVCGGHYRNMRKIAFTALGNVRPSLYPLPPNSDLLGGTAWGPSARIFTTVGQEFV